MSREQVSKESLKAPVTRRTVLAGAAAVGLSTMARAQQPAEVKVGLLVPISGLYAAGEVIGLYYGTYTGATSVLRGAVFGRKAGLHAAARGR